MKNAVLRYIGKGEFYIGGDGTVVPTQDLPAFAVAKYGAIIEEQAKLTGKKLYEPVDPPKADKPEKTEKTAEKPAKED